MMRSIMYSIVVPVLAVLAALAAPVPASGLAESSVSSAASVSELTTAQPPKDTNVDSNVNRDGGGVAWYRTPVRIALGGGVILVLLVLLTRVGGTTVGDAGYEDRI